MSCGRRAAAASAMVPWPCTHHAGRVATTANASRPEPNRYLRMIAEPFQSTVKHVGPCDGTVRAVQTRGIEPSGCAAYACEPGLANAFQTMNRWAGPNEGAEIT